MKVTAEQPEQEEQRVVSANEDATEAGEGGFIPRGAFVFALVLIVGYFIYFFMIWYEVVILRGGA